MSHPSLRLADRVGLLSILGTVPLVAIVPYYGTALAHITAAIWYAFGVTAMVFLTLRAGRAAPAGTAQSEAAGPAAILYRLLGDLVLSFVGVVVTVTVIAGRSASVSEARWTGREAKESAVLRDVIYACSLYSTDPHGPRSFPASLTELQRWLDSANAAKEWGSSSLSPSRADLGQEVVGLQHDKKVVYLGRGIPVSGVTYIVLVARLPGPGRARFLVAKSDATVTVLSAGSLKKVFQRDEQLRIDHHLLPPPPKLKRWERL
ncbi:MAG: hypothetical protein ACYCUV_04545 [Phycisphaerae bacterium]